MWQITHWGGPSTTFSFCTANSTPEQVEDFISESAIMLNFDHPNILHLLGVCFDTEDHFPLIILPLMSNGDLKSFLIRKRGDGDVDTLPLVCDTFKCTVYIINDCFIAILTSRILPSIIFWACVSTLARGWSIWPKWSTSTGTWLQGTVCEYGIHVIHCEWNTMIVDYESRAPIVCYVVCTIHMIVADNI